MNRKLTGLVVSVSLLAIVLSSCFGGKHYGLPTTRLGGLKCVVIEYPDEKHVIALPVKVYDIYYRALAKDAAALKSRQNPIGDISVSVNSFRDEISAIDIKPYYDAMAKKKDIYDLYAWKKFVSLSVDSIADLLDLCVSMYNSDKYNKDSYNNDLYYKCIQENLSKELNFVHQYFPMVQFDLSGIIDEGIKDMLDYANPNKYDFEEYPSLAKQIARRIDQFRQYDYQGTDEQRAEILNIEQAFKKKAGLPTNTDGNGE